jgi:glycosyltransferase involved in cell wall biosynthesis
VHIVYLYQYFGTPKGSWSTRVYELSKRWIEAGNRVTVITSPYEKSDIKAKGFISKQNIEGINVIVINAADSNRNSIPIRAIKAILFALVSIYYALRLKYDVVISSSGPITVGLPMLFARKVRKKSTVFEVRDLWPAGGIEMKKITKWWQIKLALTFEKLCYRNADLVVTASPGQKEYIEQRHEAQGILVIPNASDNDLFGEISTESLPDQFLGVKLFTHIGSLGFIHNCILQIKAFEVLEREFKRGDIHLALIGEGAERQMLQDYVNQKGLKNIHFLGLKPKKELPVWVQNSVATLFTTLNNPVQNASSPNKVFDSFAAGIPVIQTTTGWIHDLIEKNQCGINVAPDNPEKLARAIINLTDNNELRVEMCRNARSLALEEFNRDVLAEKYLQALKKVVNG